MIQKGAILVVDDTHANLKLLTDILAAHITETFRQEMGRQQRAA